MNDVNEQVEVQETDFEEVTVDSLPEDTVEVAPPVATKVVPEVEEPPKLPEAILLVTVAIPNENLRTLVSASVGGIWMSLEQQLTLPITLPEDTSPERRMDYIGKTIKSLELVANKQDVEVKAVAATANVSMHYECNLFLEGLKVSSAERNLAQSNISDIFSYSFDYRLAN